MKYRFDVNLSEDDYWEFNKFYTMKSHYGKKQIANLRIKLALVFGIAIVVYLIIGKFDKQSIITSVVILIFGTVFQIIVNPLVKSSLKRTIKIQKKIGKMPFSSNSVVEFYEDCFIESTDEHKTEQKYSAIERVYIVNNKMVYLFINSIGACLLPYSCFRSKEEFDDFSDFIKTICSNIEYFN